jgi:hypothetical protein
VAVALVIALLDREEGDEPDVPGPRPPLPRVVVDTDLGGDPDDIHSLVRLVHYSDLVDVRGIISSPGPAAEPDLELIEEWIRRTDVEHLRARGHPELAREQDLLDVVAQGAEEAGPPGPGRSSPGSELLVERGLEASPEDPLWVLVWGSLTTVAQALHDEPGIAGNLRIYSIGDFNTTADLESHAWLKRFLREEAPELWWIENGALPRLSRSTFRGVWSGGDQSGEYHRRRFLERHIRGHGSTHGGDFDELTGDALPEANSPPEAVGGLKEGDSPSLLYLLSPVLGGVGDLDDPTAPSWGGQFRHLDERALPNHYVDLDCEEPADCQRTISRWREAFLGHWAERWDRYEIAGDGDGDGGRARDGGAGSDGDGGGGGGRDGGPQEGGRG